MPGFFQRFGKFFVAVPIFHNDYCQNLVFGPNRRGIVMETNFITIWFASIWGVWKARNLISFEDK